MFRHYGVGLSKFVISMNKSECCGAAMVAGGLQCEVCGSNGSIKHFSELTSAVLALKSIGLEPTGVRDWGLQLECPFCISQGKTDIEHHIHFNSPRLRESDNYSAWHGRGAALRIPLYCEEGHSWYLRFGHHKGQTYIATERVYDQDFSGTPHD